MTALTVGFALGYGVREWISRRRRQAGRRRRGLDGGFWTPRGFGACRRRRGAPYGEGRWFPGGLSRLRRRRLLCSARSGILTSSPGLFCRIARERAAHAISSVDDPPAVGALGAFGLRRQASRR